MAILMAPDGDWVSDYYGCSTKDEVWNKLDDQGSRWFFYPFHFIVVDNGKSWRVAKEMHIVDVLFSLKKELLHKTIEDASTWMKENPDYAIYMLEY
jgi:hypothetical protein